MKSLARIITFTLLTALAWLAWQAPASAPDPRMIRAAIPDRPVGSQGSEIKTDLWRVVTRRVVSKAAVYSLSRRLQGMKLEPISIEKEEDVTMHAFDDAILFKTRAQAWEASRIWKSHDIESTVIKADEAGVFLVGLGRFFQAKYAEAMQQRLEHTGRKYRYQKRIVPIPSWRFTFAPGSKEKADILWEKLHATGVIMPVLMPEPQFQKLYGSN
ncbi:hypothetical protein MMIC_P0398 [Mariprofundus micogutta]|uniref:SPOR domain-containing protein n=1 Tax=Mariprofundus micogutta TaxID=1921010 RepID=A0A1L8CKM6_9PROT|nr:hypothetical protein [Mariprofundus micogutta]GAV19464.1 hypothetical protein MMIC_P0398 [Mariprofundus micogutta]